MPIVMWLLPFLLLTVIPEKNLFVYSEYLKLNIGTFSNAEVSGPCDSITYDHDNDNNHCALLSGIDHSYCKYYGECCGDVVRIRERLESGTYQCMNIGNTQGYVVNRCPAGTAEELGQLCASSGMSEHPSDLSLKAWPVTGAYTGVTYRNMYCAICNGALDPMTDGEALESFDMHKALEFWAMDVRCTNDTTELIESRKAVVNAKMLQLLFNKRKCWAVYTETSLNVHNPTCRFQISTCPKDYTNQELRLLCEEGPTNNNFTTGLNIHSFKNEFCKQCWKDRALPEILNLPDLEILNNGTLLATFKLLTQKETDSSLSNDDFRMLNPPLAYFLSLTNNISDSEFFSKPNERTDDENDVEFWHLGSLACRSNFSRVCGEFIIFPSADGEELCSGAGCGENQVQDLTNTCINLDTYQYNKSLTLNRTFTWGYSVIGKYMSSCGDGEAMNCNCDPRCHYFGDCCWDAAPSPSDVTYQMKWTCYGLYDDSYPTGMLVVDACPDGADVTETELCNAGTIGKWNSLSWLVTDKITKLTYKNIYCASCNNASDLIFWDVFLNCPSDPLGSVTGSCSLDSFAPSSTAFNFFYPCSLNKHYIDRCPEIYNDWKLSRDCATANVSYVYYEDKIFRNYFCAICHLGDSLEEMTLLPVGSAADVTDLVTPYLSQDTDYNFVRVSYDSWKCTTSCLYGPIEKIPIGNITNSWGSVSHPVTESCIPTPFNITCGMDSSAMICHANSASNDSDIRHVCASDILACGDYPSPFATTEQSWTDRTTMPFGEDGFPGDIGDPGTGGDITDWNIFSTTPVPIYSSTDEGPSRIERVFLGPSQDMPAQKSSRHINKAKWSMANSTLELCPDRSIISVSSSKRYDHVLLTFTGIEVKENILELAPKSSRQTLDLLVYEYFLITISLGSIVFYIIFLFTKRRKSLRLPDHMMIALLLCLFGALICYALLTLPAGKDFIGCQALAAITQFFFLASLTWSNSIAISVVRSLVTMRLARGSTKSLIYYSLYSFGLPFTCVIITYVLHKLHLLGEIADFKSSVYNVEDLCFLSEQITMFSFFLVPIYCLIICNVILAIVTMSKVAKGGRIGSSPDKDRLKKNIITCIKVSFCLGLGWVLLFIASFYRKVWVAVSVFVELQGLFVVLSNVFGWSCVRKVRASISTVSSRFSSTKGSVSTSSRTASNTDGKNTISKL